MTAGVGDDVKMTCSRNDVGSLFWIKINTENVPQFLGGTSFPGGVDPRITTVKEHGTFVLHIKKTKLSDTGIYHCIKVRHNLIFLKGADLRVKGKYIQTKLSDFFFMILVISILTCNI